MEGARGTLLRHCPLLSEDQVSRLAKAGVVSAEDIMVAETADVALRSGGSLSSEEVATLRTTVAEFFGPATCSLKALLLTELRGPSMRSSGQEDFDALFGGGLPCAKVVELVGPMGVGKTQLCIWAASRLVARSRDASVVFISSSNAVSAGRFLDMLHFVPEEERADMLARIRLMHCFDAEQLMQALCSVYDALGESGRGVTPFENPISLIVVDSVASLLQPTLGKTPFGHSLLFSFRNVVLECASVSQAAVIVTNFQQFTPVVGSDAVEAEVTMNGAMGPSWSQVPGMRVWMQPTEDGSDGAIMTLTSNYFQKACKMEISKHGLRFIPRR